MFLEVLYSVPSSKMIAVHPNIVVLYGIQLYINSRYV